MKYVQTLAVMALSATLVMAAACGQQETPVGEAANTAQIQKDLDQAKHDLQTVQAELTAKSDELATKTNELGAKDRELAAKTAELQNLQKQLDAANAAIADVTQKVQDAMKVAAPAPAPTPQ